MYRLIPREDCIDPKAPRVVPTLPVYTYKRTPAPCPPKREKVKTVEKSRERYVPPVEGELLSSLKKLKGLQTSKLTPLQTPEERKKAEKVQLQRAKLEALDKRTEQGYRGIIRDELIKIRQNLERQGVPEQQQREVLQREAQQMKQEAIEDREAFYRRMEEEDADEEADLRRLHRDIIDDDEKHNREQFIRDIQGNKPSIIVDEDLYDEFENEFQDYFPEGFKNVRGKGKPVSWNTFKTYATDPNYNLLVNLRDRTFIKERV